MLLLLGRYCFGCVRIQSEVLASDAFRPRLVIRREDGGALQTPGVGENFFVKVLQMRLEPSRPACNHGLVGSRL